MHFYLNHLRRGMSLCSRIDIFAVGSDDVKAKYELVIAFRRVSSMKNFKVW